MQKAAYFLRKALTPVSWWSLLFGGIALVIMMLTVVVDVTMRSTLSIALRGSIDIVDTCLIIVLFCGVAYVEFQREHIYVTVVTEKFSAAVQQAIVTSGYLLTTAVASLVTWRTLMQALNLKGAKSVIGILHIPEWPFIFIAGIFLGLFSLAVLTNLLEYLDELWKTSGVKGFLGLIPGIAISFGFFLLIARPELLPFKIAPATWGGIIFLLLFALIFLRVPIAIAMGLTSVLGISYLNGTEPALTSVAISIIAVARDYTWSVIPLFLWMGLLVFHTGFARELYSVTYKWVGHLPGGLASASVGACAGLAALVGDNLTGVLTMGSLALPEMKSYNYDSKFSTACICTASTIGMLIPPSIPFIVYGMITEISIGKLFIAGVIPGILFTIILVGMITVFCRLNPKLGPRGPTTSWKERIISLKDVWAVAMLIVIVLGGIYLGIFTPTEAGAVGAFGALVIGLIRRRLSFKGFSASITGAIKMNSMIMFIFLLATAFSRFLPITNLPYMLAHSVTAFSLSPYLVMAMILLIYLFLGCVMNAIPAVILTLPIFFPIAMEAGFDPLLFGVLVVIMVQMGTITPPIGMNVFAMSAIAKDVPMYGIFKGILPFWIAFIILVVILVAFPQISLTLPSFM